MADQGFCGSSSGDIVKQGYLFVKRPPRRRFDMLRAWHKRFLVLKDETSERGPLLEMYTSQEEALLQCTAPACSSGGSTARASPAAAPACCRLCFDLAQTVHVGFTSDSKRFPNALVLVCQGRSPLVLAAQDELGSRSWLLALGLIAHKASSQHGWRFMCRKASEQAAAMANCAAFSSSVENSASGAGSTDLGSSCRTRTARGSGGSSGACEGDSAESLDGVLIPPPLEYGDGCLDMLFSRERFPVTVQPSEASERLGLRGEYQLVILGHSVGLLRPGAAEPFLVWPVTCIRQYRHELLLQPGQGPQHAASCAKAAAARGAATLVTIEVGRRCCTGEGAFQFRTQRGQEVIRELKRAVSLWAARKAALASWCQSRAVAQRSSCVRLGRSAPATPSLSMPPAWRRQPESPEAARSCGGGGDTNYVLPAFERSSSSLSNGSVLSSPQLGRPCQSDPERLGTRADSSCEDANYVRVTAAVHSKGRVSFRKPGSPPLPPPLVQLVTTTGTLPHDKKLQEIRRAEGYIEVLPT
ncbi:uncharacterized protein LOC142579840 isoform X2 [Dermacentor variabilis]|uniref:uncharacterized protein LOC142579840 isoform X2 n=1 Tax=Dermacentor variabilis TaxID=34621 RepID=UPI003F5B108C